jgi:hypothetical protein
VPDDRDNTRPPAPRPSVPGPRSTGPTTAPPKPRTALGSAYAVGPIPGGAQGPVPPTPPDPPQQAYRPEPTRLPQRAAAPRTAATPRFFPPPPRNLEETGLTPSLVEELVLKALFFAGEMRGGDISDHIKLPQAIVDETIENLRRSKYIDLKGSGGMGMGKTNMVFTLTTFATDLLRQILDRNRYNGPAPVRLEDWFEAVKAQTVRGSRITRPKMEDKFGDLIVKDYIYDGLGPAMNSGRAVFFYGPPGNGKTAFCQALIRCYEGEIFIPYALLVDDFIIRVYDPILHESREDSTGANSSDARWVRCARPLVVVGGELTLETLDLIYSSEVKYYEAPFQLKATNGMLLVDDFGRQRVSPKDLLNRWIVPLESDIDFLTLHTGKKLQVPFDVFTAFSTNLDPADLVDDAFLRRVRYKLEVKPPDLEQFHAIWQMVCRKYKVQYEEDIIDDMIARHFTPTRKMFAACQPRDLLGQVIDIAHYRGETPRLTGELLDAAAHNYFVRFNR